MFPWQLVPQHDLASHSIDHTHSGRWSTVIAIQLGRPFVELPTVKTVETVMSYTLTECIYIVKIIFNSL